MTNLYHFFAALWIACTAIAYDVVELDGAHFELIQSEYHYIAVLFYDSSPFGEKLKKEWVEGMKLVDQSLPVGCEVALVRVTALSMSCYFLYLISYAQINVEEKELKEFLASNEIGVPSVKTFRKGVISDYHGVVDRSDIANYIIRDTKVP
jgi:hypothetical protein